MTIPTVIDREPTSAYAYPPSSSSSCNGFADFYSGSPPPLLLLPPLPPNIPFPVQTPTVYGPSTPPLEGLAAPAASAPAPAPAPAPGTCGSSTDSILNKYGTDDDDEEEEDCGGYKEDEDNIPLNPFGPNKQKRSSSNNSRSSNSNIRNRDGMKGRRRRSSTPTTISIPCAPIRAYTRPRSRDIAVVPRSLRPPLLPPLLPGPVLFPSSVGAPAQGLGRGLSLGAGPSPIPSPIPVPGPGPAPAPEASIRVHHTRPHPHPLHPHSGSVFASQSSLHKSAPRVAVASTSPPTYYPPFPLHHRQHTPRRQIALILFLKFLSMFLLTPLIVAFTFHKRALAPGVVMVIVNAIVTDCVVCLLILHRDGGLGRVDGEEKEDEEGWRRGRIRGEGGKWRKIWRREGWRKEERELVRGIAVVTIGLWFGVVWVVVIVGLI